LARLDAELTVGILPLGIRATANQTITTPIYGIGAAWNSAGGRYGIRFLWEHMEPDEHLTVGPLTLASPDINLYSISAVVHFPSR
jgi:hypothetical protein